MKGAVRQAAGAAGTSGALVVTATAADRDSSQPLPGGRASARRRSIVIYSTSVVVFLAAWWIASLFTEPLFLPSPAQVVTAAADLISSGELPKDIAASFVRILSGWVIGVAVAVPAGLLAGRLHVVRLALSPFVNFFRFIPPIAFITLAIVWFGLGESSKIALIVYTTGFVVFLNTQAGAQRIEIEKIRAAQCLGASRLQVARYIVIPATFPDVVTGVRLAMGTAFMTVVAAELVAAESGIGFLIYNSRLYGQTDVAFVGVLTLGLMGLITDVALRLISFRVAYRYDLKF